MVVAAQDAKRLDEIDAWLAQLGCGDGSCVIGPPLGMHTNGGCNCVAKWHEDWPKELRRNVWKAIHLYREKVRILEGMR